MGHCTSLRPPSATFRDLGFIATGVDTTFRCAEVSSRETIACCGADRVGSSSLYHEHDPHAQGYLEVGYANRIYWECCGTPSGKPAVVLHGDPGSGCSPWYRRFFDPSAYRVVLFDQRNCARSTPNASLGTSDLSTNTTSQLIDDIERLRCHLNVQQWLVLGGSWGSTLALAYAERHPARVTEIILFGVTTGQRSEFDWLFRGGLAHLFPLEWERLLSWLSPEEHDGDIVEAYGRRLNSPDPLIREHAAFEWCMWECATPEWPPSKGLAKRFSDPDYRLAFARIVTHYVSHNAWLEDGVLLRNCCRLADIPGVLINGRFDFQSPLVNAWRLKQVWKKADLVVVNNAGHWLDQNISRAITGATDRFAERR
jgi:proline iminopeptidase